MKTLLVVFLAFLSSCLFNTVAYADKCSDYKQKTGLDLNVAECYVLEQVEKGEPAHFMNNRIWPYGNYLNQFINVEDRTLSVDFLKDLLTGTLPNLKVTEKGVRIWNAHVNKKLSLVKVRIPFNILFSECIFEEQVDFTETQFLHRAYFGSVQFSREVDFSKAQFSKKAYFGYTQFSEEVSFGMAEFSEDADFPKAQFFKTVDFSNCKFRESSNFTTCYYPDRNRHTYFDNVTGFSDMHMVVAICCALCQGYENPLGARRA